MSNDAAVMSNYAWLAATVLPLHAARSKIVELGRSYFDPNGRVAPLNASRSSAPALTTKD